MHPFGCHPTPTPTHLHSFRFCYSRRVSTYSRCCLISRHETVVKGAAQSGIEQDGPERLVEDDDFLAAFRAVF